MRNGLVLRGGTVVDGTGRPSFGADVLVEHGRILEVGRVERTRGTREVDVSGLAVCPGFIDVHTHYDAQVLWDPALSSSTRFGVTTVVMGNCGFSVAPVAPDDAAYLIQLLARVEGMPVPSLQEGLDWSWHTFADYLQRLARPLGPNVVSMVGHSALRRWVLGEDAAARPATPEEIGSMQDALREALAAGACGFSSSGSLGHNDLAGRPAPSRLAERGELEAFADVVGEFDGGVIGMSPMTKLKGLSADDRDVLVSLSLRSGAPVLWNPLLHAPALPDLVPTNLSASQEARAAGARVYAVYNPASRGPVRVDLETCYLFEALPHWKPIASLPTSAKVEQFRRPDVRKLLAEDIAHNESLGVLAAQLRAMWPILRITQVASAENERFLGRTVGEIAGERGRSALDTMIDIALTDGLKTVFMQDDEQNESEDARAVNAMLAASPDVIFGGSDAGAHVDMMANQALPVRTIAWRVRAQEAMTLEATVRGFTSTVADRLGLRDRGRIVPGAAADIVVFDPDTVDESPPRVLADLPGRSERLQSDAVGVHHVLVNGELLVEGGRATGTLPGQLLTPRGRIG